jgi:hypothetical protein
VGVKLLDSLAVSDAVGKIYWGYFRLALGNSVIMLGITWDIEVVMKN